MRQQLSLFPNIHELCIPQKSSLTVAVGGPDYFHDPNGGDSMGLIQDMGEVLLEDVTAQSVFVAHDLHFERHAKVQSNHTYAVLLNQLDKRGLVVFTVAGYVRNERVDLKYAVKNYQILLRQSESPGFDWGERNF